MDTTKKTTPPDNKRAIAAGAIGNFIEWFDFVSYGALAAILAPRFFPSENSTVSVITLFATFALAFLFRPLGGFVFGLVGDRVGRRSALSASVMLMSLATVVIGSLPTVEAIGLWATVLIVLARCVQAFAAGGEWSGSVVYMVEFGDQRRRSFHASLTPTGAWLGAMAAVGVVSGLNAVFGQAAVDAWAWRVPFLLAAPLGLIGLYLRLRIRDTPEFEALKSADALESRPVREAFRSHKRALLLIFIGAATNATCGYILLTYMATYLTTTVGVSRSAALATNTIAIGVTAIATVLFGIAADRVGRKPVFIGSLLAQVVIVVPVFVVLSHGSVAGILIGQCVLGVAIGAAHAPFAVLCVELFPARVRYAASGVGYSIGSGVVGGLAPLVATALVAASGSAIAPAFYLGGVVLTAFVVFTALLPETRGLNESRTSDTRHSAGQSSTVRTTALTE
ncbi:MFS transporter [Rhodococcus sp. USK10]|uniref:MFS transporter n=1 Tax=Rhodococcus sp. USK10 TaxID=2789739 RepID=UPI001C5FEA46|nr:MFS transporter [Rhodococcus sp. USK10]QYB07139.1 MFS transporter [Rhodococcus sp. USK10]